MHPQEGPEKRAGYQQYSAKGGWTAAITNLKSEKCEMFAGRGESEVLPGHVDGGWHIRVAV
jgi:hypothetical protein